MTVNNEHFMKLADDAEEKMIAMINQVANLRLECLANEFRLKFPKRSLKILFGNGDECIALDGHKMQVFGADGARLQGVFRATRCTMTYKGQWAEDALADQLEFIAQTVRDVWAITNHYRRGCPDDLEVLPDDSELQGGPNVENEIITIRKAVGSDIRDHGEHPAYDCPRPGSPGDAVHIQ